MTLFRKHSLSLEAIRYQGKTLLFNDLVVAYAALMENKQFDKKHFDAMRLSSIVKYHTKLNVNFVFEPSGVGEVAFSRFPVPNINSPLLDHIRSWINTPQHKTIEAEVAKDFLRNVDLYRKGLRGSLNLKDGTVSGVFAKLESVVWVSTEYFTGGRYTAEEIAAVTLHEIGHVFTYFEKLTAIATTNMVLASASHALSKTVDPTIRLQLVIDAAEMLDASLENPAEVAAHTTKPEVFQSVLLKAHIEKSLHSTHDSSRYDQRSVEFLSDQFAVRHGAGRYLAIALNKSDRFNQHPSTRSWGQYVLVEAMKTAGTLAVAVKLPVLIPAILIGMFAVDGVEMNLYDPPGERLARIKQDLVQCLKDMRLPKELRAEILNDVEIVDTLREDVNDRRTVFDFICSYIIPNRRRQQTQMVFQQELEKLVSNDLFVSAAKIQSMSIEGVASQ